MYICTVPNHTLSAIAGIAAAIADKKGTLPILAHTVFRIEGGTLTLIASDQEMQLRQSVDLGEASTGPFSTTINARRLSEIAKSLPQDGETAFTSDAQKIVLKAGKSRFTLQTLPDQDFPIINPQMDSSRVVSLPQRAFRALLKSVEHAMADKDVRYYLNGMLLHVTRNEIRAIATDGHRLALNSEPSAGAPEIKVILPRKAISELSRMLADSDDLVSVAVGDRHACFSFGNRELVTKLIEGAFPDYERVIPESQPHVAEVHRELLLKSLSRTAILANGELPAVRVVIQPGRLQLNTENTSHENALEEIDINYDGASIETGFNVRYLLDAISSTSSEKVQLQLRDPNSSALVTLPGNDRSRCVVMPVRV